MTNGRRRNLDPILHRDPSRSYPLAARAEGAWISDADGKRYLDAAGGVFVVNLGHTAPAVVQAIATQASRMAFAHTAHFTTEPEEDLASRLLAIAPEGMAKAWICTSGSQANETAVKLARLYHLLGNDAGRVQVVSRWNSYHGSTLGALALTGHTARREQFVPYLAASPKIEPPYCYRCPFGKTYPSCGLACADALDETVTRIGPGNVSAFIVEPVSGGPLGALVPPAGYFERIREICDRHGMLMIVDEVITGAGRTGKPYGIQHSDVVPDIMTLAKGIGGGFVPIGAVLVRDRVVERLQAGGQPIRHGETFTGHALIAAAGAAVMKALEDGRLIERARDAGRRLGERLASLRSSPVVGDVRGVGMLWGLELVADKTTKSPFPRSRQMAERVAKAAFERGLLVIAGTGCVNGRDGDTIALAPPFIISDEEIEQIVIRLADAIESQREAD